MTPEQLHRYRDLLKAGKPADDKLSEDRVFLRGFAAGVTFSEECLAKVLKEEASP